MIASIYPYTIRRPLCSIATFSCQRLGYRPRCARLTAMEIPGMPLPVLDGDKGAAGTAAATADGARYSPRFDASPFPLPELELGSMKVTKGKRKGIAVLDDDDDPREEAQLMQLFEHMQKVKESKENKRKRNQIAARASRTEAGVRKNATKQIDQMKVQQKNSATELRKGIDTLRADIHHEVSLAATILSKQQDAMKTAMNDLDERYGEAEEVQRKMKLLADCMRQHFDVVRNHVASQVDGKITETEEVVQGIHGEPDKMLSIITSAGMK